MDGNELSSPASLPTLKEEQFACPAFVAKLGPHAHFAWAEFFEARIRNKHTRRAYGRIVRNFIKVLENEETELPKVTPAHVARYIDALHLSVPSKKQVLAGLRHFFDWLVQRHVLVLNPAASVRGERYSVDRGTTPGISPAQVRRLLGSIDTESLVGLRDKSLLCVLVYTACRVGAVATLRIGDFVQHSGQYHLRVYEKRNRRREFPVRHDLQQMILEFRTALFLEVGDEQPVDHWDARPLFPTALGASGRLTSNPMSSGDIARMLKRRLFRAGLPGNLSPHSFRVATITDLLAQDVPLEDVQHLAGHSDPRTTRLYDRRNQTVTRNLVERISL